MKKSNCFLYSLFNCPDKTFKFKVGLSLFPYFWLVFYRYSSVKDISIIFTPFISYPDLSFFSSLVNFFRHIFPYVGIPCYFKGDYVDRFRFSKKYHFIGSYKKTKRLFAKLQEVKYGR